MKKVPECEYKGKWKQCPDFRPWPWESPGCVDMFGDGCCSPTKKAVDVARKILEDMPEWQRKYAEEIIETAITPRVDDDPPRMFD